MIRKVPSTFVHLATYCIYMNEETFIGRMHIICPLLCHSSSPPPPPPSPAPLERDQELGEDIDTAASWPQLYAYPSMVEEFMDIQPGSPLSCQVNTSSVDSLSISRIQLSVVLLNMKYMLLQVTVLEGCGLPREYCHYVFCQYQFWGQEEPMIIPPLQGQNTTDQKMVDRVQFSHSQVIRANRARTICGLCSPKSDHFVWYHMGLDNPRIVQPKIRPFVEHLLVPYGPGQSADCATSKQTSP